MRLRSLLVGLGGAGAVCAACGGDAFTLANVDEGGAGDVSPESSGGSGSGGSSGSGSSGSSDASGGDAVAEGSAPDGDATVVPDAPADAIAQPDVFEEPPPHCAGAFACVPVVPPGWSGPMELFQGSGPRPACGVNFESPIYDGNDVLTAAPATCGCTCNSATGVQCSSPPLSFFAGPLGLTSCTSSEHCTNITLTPNTCTGVDIFSPSQCSALGASNAYFSAGSPLASGGSCVPVPMTSVQPSSWGVGARACFSALPQVAVDCPVNQVCAPLTASPFQSGLCVMHAGDVQCPSGYPTQHVYFQGSTDTRGCTACTCGSVTGATCVGKINVSSSTDLSCSANVITYPLPLNTCSAVQQPGEFMLLTGASGGTCTPSSPTATGTTTATSPTTFCCTQ